ncbi:hypothetical protein PoB_002665300 [Plakobranchus ocellatus]|uniref:Secreted protein n=1 Tax=Plakobranchus ocellatus TaxID=259542 RepID=A0AAV4A0F6_9GAST|nr:hypothetical protein PoB_002665300 [Plakobranchus ocellatus]
MKQNLGLHTAFRIIVIVGLAWLPDRLIKLVAETFAITPEKRSSSNFAPEPDVWIHRHMLEGKIPEQRKSSQAVGYEEARTPCGTRLHSFVEVNQSVRQVQTNSETTQFVQSEAVARVACRYSRPLVEECATCAFLRYGVFMCFDLRKGSSTWDASVGRLVVDDAPTVTRVTSHAF